MTSSMQKRVVGAGSVHAYKLQTHNVHQYAPVTLEGHALNVENYSTLMRANAARPVGTFNTNRACGHQGAF